MLTHAHRSHLGGLAALKRATGATVLAHEWEADIVAGERPAQSVGLKPTQPLLTYPFQVGIFLGRPKHEPCPIDEPLADGAAVGPLEVLHIPGHSPGHLGFHLGGAGSRDRGRRDRDLAALRGRAGRAFNLNLEQHRRSIRRLAGLEASIVGVGHGDPVTEAAADRVHALVV